MARCGGCRGQITGPHLKALGKHWHPECLVCGSCGEPIHSQAFAYQGKTPYHSECHARRFAPVCAGCQKTIGGKALRALDRSWHPKCFCCAACGKPITQSSFLTQDRDPYHERCYHKAFTKPCEVCGVPLTGTYLSDVHGHMFCPTHQEELTPCEACHRLICDRLTGGGIQFNDGLVLCNRCSPSAVTSPKEAAEVFARVRTSFEAMGFSLGHQKTPLRLVDRHTLAGFQEKKKRQGPSLGMARKRIHTRGRRGRQEVVGREFLEIIIQAGLPRSLFETVAVHELCHAWLFFSGADDLPVQVEEGLCTLCEDLWLTKHPSAENQARQKVLRENEDPIYGDGYRQAYQIYRARGRANLFKYVVRHGRFPRLGLTARWGSKRYQDPA